MTSQKHGISALGLKRTLGIGSEQTAWAMLHRYRTAMLRSGRERLTATGRTPACSRKGASRNSSSTIHPIVGDWAPAIHCG
jgi:hypothetical protein